LDKPKLADKFDAYQADGINVYLRKDIKVKDDRIHVFLRKFLWIKDLAVDGLRINY